MDVRTLCASFLYNVSLSQANITRMLNDGTFAVLPMLMGVKQGEGGLGTFIEEGVKKKEEAEDGSGSGSGSSGGGSGGSGSGGSGSGSGSGGEDAARPSSAPLATGTSSSSTKEVNPEIIQSCAHTMYNLVGLKRQCVRAVSDQNAVLAISYFAFTRLTRAKIMAGAILCRLAQESE